MDGQSRTCIEWMCNDEYEPGSFDLTNIMSPPDHESMFHSLMNATPLGGEDSLAAGAWSLGRRNSDTPPGLTTPTSLVSLVQQLDLSGPERTAPPAPGASLTAATGTTMTTAKLLTGDDAADSFADPALAPSLTQAVSEALGVAPAGADSSGFEHEEPDAVGYNLTRVTSAAQLADLPDTEGERPALVRRPSVSCPNSPPRARRAGHSFFTPSIFYPERPAEICREWRERHPDQTDAPAAAAAGPLAAAAGPLAAAAGVSGLPPAASLASVAGMGEVPTAERKRVRTRPRPSRLRELNFLAPTSM